MKNELQISVVISLDRRTDCYREILAALDRQSVSLSEHEVIWVDADDTPAAAQALRAAGPELQRRINLRFFRIERGERASARNFGIRQARGRVILLFADDFIPAPRWLETHLRFHEAHPAEHRIGIGPGFFTESLRDDPFTRWLEDSGSLWGANFPPPDPAAMKGFFYGANTSLKRSLLDRSGLFDKMFPFHTTDDYELGLRLKALGAESVYLPEARAVHKHEHWITLEEREQAMWETGVSLALLQRKHADHPGPSGGGAVRARVNNLLANLPLPAPFLFRLPSLRERYWQARLSRAFTQGYQAATTVPQALSSVGSAQLSVESSAKAG